MRPLTLTFATLCSVGLLAALSISPTIAAQVASASMPYFSDGDAARVQASAEPAPSTQSVITANGGAVVTEASFAGAGMAARYPSFDGTSTAPRAVVAMANSTTTDVLTPGAKVFTFGADVNSDSVSTGTRYDNGNNILQRGLYGDPAQYKLQIDNGHALCRVKGDQGSASLTSPQLLPSNEWFRIACTRKVFATGDQLVLSITPITASGVFGTPIINRSGVKPIGKLNFASSRALSIGGKLTAMNAIHLESDQFNGLIDNPSLDIG